MYVSSRLSVFMVDCVRVSSCMCQVDCLSSWLIVSELPGSSCLCQVDCLSSWLIVSELVHVCVK